MERKIYHHPDRDLNFETGAYTDAVQIGDFIYVSGQAAVDFKKSAFVLGSVEDETVRTMENILLILGQAGATASNIIKATVHLADISDFDRFNNVYAQFFNDLKPARTTVQSVLAAGIKIEIDCVAWIAPKKDE
ncbi:MULTISPECIES: RidA family protein [Sphingobacterium]|uniref:RidA family protein n=1 Tax=Sphingobacterium TaxID=28453 RepID=UPI00257CEB3B|nr:MULTISPECIES: Rid family hydrolase [Sphingobacterium]